MTANEWQTLLPPLLRRAGLMSPIRTVEPLTGGVSSDIVRVTLIDGSRCCAKRALPQLKVAGDWQAPLARNHYEAAWLRQASAIVPGAAPDVLAEDEAHGVALLEYLPPEDFILWKAELLAGRADPAVPRRMGELLGRIHAATLDDAAAARAFATDNLFDALRLDPYLRTTAARHPDLAGPILACLEQTRSTRWALVHGDVSPKNILVARADGHPVLLDAECAWFGDPAFDAAFCLNHLVLKAVHLPAIRAALLQQADDLFAAWIAHFPLERQPDAERRTATLLPCLMLARIDGKSPVEYLDGVEQQHVRDLARPLIASPLAKLPDVLGDIGDRLGRA